jgi:hypothetical protein
LNDSCENETALPELGDLGGENLNP